MTRAERNCFDANSVISMDYRLVIIQFTGLFIVVTVVCTDSAHIQFAKILS